MAKVEWLGGLHDDDRSEIEPHPQTKQMFDTILFPYFRKAYFNERGVAAEFTANFHCSHSRQAQTYDVVVTIPDSIWDTSSSFYYLNIATPRYLKGSPNIKLEYKSKTIGILCPETQTLWATAWTHQGEYSPRVQYIIDFLVGQGLLRPVSPIPMGKIKKEKTIFTITLGGDPEFELVDSYDDVINASDTDESFDLDESFGNLGLDGSGDQVELRPSPGSPDEVVANIRQLLEQFGSEYGNDYRLAASSDYYPCGGHIHIGVDPLPSRDYYKKLSYVLDDFIGMPTKKLNGPARNSNNDDGYGRINDWREQNHGMEYRTPPSGVWRNPNLTRTILKLTYNLAIQLANGLSVEYSTPINEAELTNVGRLSEEEAHHYIRECDRSAPRHTECLLAAWNVRAVPRKSKMKIIFRDDWDPEIQRTLRSLFASMEMSVPKGMVLTFYGLRSDRGDVFTFEMPDKTMIAPPNHSDRDNYFGFPRRFRDGVGSDAETSAAARSIFKIIQKSTY